MWDLFIVSPFFKFLAKLWTLLLMPIVLISGVSASVTQLAGDDAIQATPRTYKFDNDKLLLGAYYYDPAFTDDAHIGYVQEAGLDFLITSATPDSWINARNL